MPSSFWGPLLFWLLIYGATLPATWQLIWPPYKRYGKPLFSLAISAVLAWNFGWWSLLFVILHTALGLAIHAWFCRAHGLPIWQPDPAQYRDIQRRWVESRGQAGKPPTNV